MKRTAISVVTTFALAGLLIPTTGCPFLFPGFGGDNNGNTNTNDNSSDNSNDNSSDNANDNSSDNSNDNSGGGGNFSPIKTDIEMHQQGRILAGDDLIVYGTGGFFGVDYIVPSTNPTTGAGLPNGDNYQAGSFAIAGKKIALLNNFQVTIYDTVNDTTNTIPLEDIRLINTPSRLDDPGHIRGEGNYIATRNDDGEVTDGKVIKVIDTSGAMPMVISFDVNPANDTATQVAIDAETKTVVAVSNDIFYVYDIDNPMDAPLMWDVSGMGGINSDTQIAYDDGVLVYMNDDLPEQIYMLDANSQSNMPELIDINNKGAAAEVAYCDGAYGFFTDDESNGTQVQSVIGTNGSPLFAEPIDDFIDGSTTNNGIFGFAQTIQVGKDGSGYWAAGSETVGSGEYLMYSSGGKFGLFPDPTGDDQYGCRGTDVRVSHNTVAFKSGDNSGDTYVAYIILNGN